MGARNVGAALALYPDLPHRAMRLLVGMALQALDPDATGVDQREACRSFMGQDALAEVLGFRADSRASVATRRKIVRVVLAELREAGAIDVLEVGAGGRRSVFLLNLDPLTRRGVAPRLARSDEPRQEGRSTPPQEGRSTPPQEGRSTPPQEGRSTPPKEYGGGLRRNSQEDNRLGASSRLAAASVVEDPEIDAARTGLAALGPDRQQAYLGRAAAEGITTTRAIMLRAHELARATR